MDPELFFPAAASGPARDEQVAAAKAVCAGCPVRAACLEFALAALSHGIAGGLDETERRDLRRTSPGGTATAAAGPGLPAEQARRSRAAGRSVAALAMEFGVSTRTVERWTRAGAA